MDFLSCLSDYRVLGFRRIFECMENLSLRLLLIVLGAEKLQSHLGKRKQDKCAFFPGANVPPAKGKLRQQSEVPLIVLQIPQTGGGL